MEACNGNSVKIFIRFNNMASNEVPHLLQGNPKFLGRFVLVILCLGGWFDLADS